MGGLLVGTFTVHTKRKLLYAPSGQNYKLFSSPRQQARQGQQHSGYSELKTPRDTAEQAL